MRNDEDDIGALEGPSERMWHLLMVLAVLIMAFIMVAASAWLSEAEAHQAPTGWTFDGWCCSGNSVTGDCQQVPSENITPIPGGVQLTLRPGDHPRVTAPQTYQMEQSKVRHSPDGRTYACLYPDQKTLRCLYLPPMGS